MKIWKIVFQFYKNNDPFNKVFLRTSRELYSKKIDGLIFSRKRRAKTLIIANNVSFNFQTMTKIRSEDGFITKRSFLDCYLTHHKRFWRNSSKDFSQLFLDFFLNKCEIFQLELLNSTENRVTTVFFYYSETWPSRCRDLKFYFLGFLRARFIIQIIYKWQFSYFFFAKIVKYIIVNIIVIRWLL